MSTVLTIVMVLVIAALGAVVWWRLFNTPDGERYVKMRTQGPFVPVQSDDADQAQTRDTAN